LGQIPSGWRGRIGDKRRPQFHYGLTQSERRGETYKTQGDNLQNQYVCVGLQILPLILQLADLIDQIIVALRQYQIVSGNGRNLAAHIVDRGLCRLV
jgi:hypothetical protein